MDETWNDEHIRWFRLELGGLGLDAMGFEADDVVGGISTTVDFEGCRMDLGRMGRPVGPVVHRLLVREVGSGVGLLRHLVL